MPNTSRAASEDEGLQAMQGDHLVPEDVAMLTRAVTIRAAPENVWPWVVQIGSGRAGWYSYDWIDNGGHPSATKILPQHQHLAPGDIVPAVPGSRDAFIVAAVEAPCHLILTVPDGSGGHQVSYEFLLRPIADGHTRLIVRGRIAATWPTAKKAAPVREDHPLFIERIYSILARIPRPLKLGIGFLGHHLMESRMLRGIKRRAEAAAA